MLCASGGIFTTDRAAWVCCNTGSGSTDKWMHSGIFIVPPSKSAIITSNWWKWKWRKKKYCYCRKMFEKSRAKTCSWQITFAETYYRLVAFTLCRVWSTVFWRVKTLSAPLIKVHQKLWSPTPAKQKKEARLHSPDPESHSGTWSARRWWREWANSTPPAAARAEWGCRGSCTSHTVSRYVQGWGNTLSSLCSQTALYLDYIWLWSFFKGSLRPSLIFLQSLILKTKVWTHLFKWIKHLETKKSGHSTT